MGRVRAIWGWPLAVCAAALLAIAPAVSAATPAALWSPAVAAGAPSSTSSTLFVSISCVSAGDCVAVGQSNTSGSQAVVAAESGGSWGSPVVVSQLPADAGTGADAISELTSVSCTSATACVAVGQYQNTTGGDNPLVVPITVSGTTPTPGTPATINLPAGAKSSTSPAQPAALNSISCPDASDCVAVGQYPDTTTGEQAMVAVPSGGNWSSWTASQATAPSGYDLSKIALTAISCSSSTVCEAVGNYADYSDDIYPWAVPVTNGVAGAAVDIALPANFVPSSNTGGIDLRGGGSDGLGAISCSSDGTCTAAGTYPTGASTSSGVVVPITGGTPAAAVPLQAAGSSSSLLTGIWCADAGDCTLAGVATPAGSSLPEPVVGAETAGSWSQLTDLALSGGDNFGLISGMTCASAGACAASGVEGSSANANAGNATFFAASVPSLSVATGALPAATVGVPYSATLQGSGGSGAYTWSIASGALPAGLSLDPATGVISGTPTGAGQSGFVAGITDQGPPVQTATASLSITVAAAPQPTGPPPKPSPKPKPTVKLVRVTTSGEKAKVTLSCKGATCAGTLKLTGVEHLKGKTPTAVAAKATATAKKSKPKVTKKTITLATAHYSLAAGKSKVFTLTLSKSAAKLLAKLHTISAYLYVTPTGAKKPAVTRKLTFKAPKKPKRKK